VSDDPGAGSGSDTRPDLSATLPSRVPFTPAIALAAVAARAARQGAPPPVGVAGAPAEHAVVESSDRPASTAPAGPDEPLLVMPARYAHTRVPVAPDPAAARRRAEHLVDALVEPGSIRAVFQPMVRLADGAVIAYEALARTRVVAGRPDQWLDAAGMVGRRVDVELACLRAVAEAGSPRDGALVSVNVSPAALLDPRLPDVLADLPRHALEITEHDAVQDYDALSAVLARLRTSGSLVAVDDVGAGYASMAHVLALAPSFVKIDRSLVEGMHRDPGRRALVQALQAFTSAIGGLTVAEGVEHVGDLDELRAVGVDLVQGYVVARPGPPWPELTPTAVRLLRPGVPGPHRDVTDLEAFDDALAAAVTQGEACEAAAAHLAAFGGLLPSVYLERGGVLRCQSRQGQWLVLDGLLPGAGLTGTAFADEREVMVEDVSTDTRYRLAAPGVRAELAVPIRVDGRVVGVCNVDSVVPISTAAATLVRRTAAQLGARLGTLPAGRESGGALHELTRFTPAVVSASGPEAVAAGVLGAVAELVGFESGCVWRLSDSGVQAAVGPQARSLAVLPPFRVQELAALVSGMSSCCTGGTGLGATSVATDALSDLGARGILLVPVRDGRRVTDLLAVVSSTRTTVPADLVVAAEHLCLLSGGRLAAQREGLGASLLRRVGRRRPVPPGTAPAGSDAVPGAAEPSGVVAAPPPPIPAPGSTPVGPAASPAPGSAAASPAADVPAAPDATTWIRQAGAGPTAEALPALLSALTATSTALAEPPAFGPLGIVSELVYRDVLAGLVERAAKAAHRLRPVVEGLGDSATARHLRYLEALALLELGRFADALVVAEQLLVEAGTAGPAWRCTALAVVAEAHTGLGSTPASIAALAEADWLLRAMRTGTRLHVRASVVVARALRAARLYERAEAVLRGLDPMGMSLSGIDAARERSVMDLLVNRERAALQAEWAAMLRLVGRDAESAARAPLVVSASLRVQRRAIALGELRTLARGQAAEAFGWLLMGEVGVAEALARSASARYDLRTRCMGRDLLHLTLGEVAMLAGREEQAAENLGTALETATTAGREVWATLARTLLAELDLRTAGSTDAALRWREVARASLAMVWTERGSRFTALHGQDSIRTLEARVERHGRASEEDPLTGLGNRRLLQRVGEGVRPETVIFVDVDDFKTINDRFSHAVGDRALEVVAQILRATARTGDLLVRYGGDEFVVVPHGPADVARALAHRIRAAVAEFDWASLAPGMSLTVSVGLGRSGHRLDGVVSADQAMLEAKRAGRNQVVEAGPEGPQEAP